MLYHDFLLEILQMPPGVSPLSADGAFHFDLQTQPAAVAPRPAESVELAAPLFALEWRASTCC
jgi:hypothetical protein